MGCELWQHTNKEGECDGQKGSFPPPLNKEGEPALFLTDKAHLYLILYNFLFMLSTLRPASLTRI